MRTIHISFILSTLKLQGSTVGVANFDSWHPACPLRICQSIDHDELGPIVGTETQNFRFMRRLDKPKPTTVAQLSAMLKHEKYTVQHSGSVCPSFTAVLGSNQTAG